MSETTTPYLKRLKEIVFPAIANDVPLLVTTGVINTRTVSTQADKTPARKTNFIAVTPGYFRSEPLRFAALVQALSYPGQMEEHLLRDSRWQMFRFAGAGACLTIPLGTGVIETTEDYVVIDDIRQRLLTGRPIHLISMQRTRLSNARNGQPLQDSVPLEAYDTNGQLVWTNPILGDVATVLNEYFGAKYPTAKATPASPAASAPVTTPSQQEKPLQATSLTKVGPDPDEPKESRRNAVITFLKKWAPYRSGDELVEKVAELANVHPGVVKAVMKTLGPLATEEDPRVAEIRDAAQGLVDLELTPEELVDSVADMTGHPLEFVQEVLSESKAAPAAPEAPATPETAAGEAPAVVPLMAEKPAPRAKAPKKKTSAPVEQPKAQVVAELPAPPPSDEVSEAQGAEPVAIQPAPKARTPKRKAAKAGLVSEPPVAAEQAPEAKQAEQPGQDVPNGLHTHKAAIASHESQILGVSDQVETPKPVVAALGPKGAIPAIPLRLKVAARDEEDSSPLTFPITFEDFHRKASQVRQFICDEIQRSATQLVTPAQLKRFLLIPEGNENEATRMSQGLKRLILTPMRDAGILEKFGSTRDTSYSLKTPEE